MPDRPGTALLTGVLLLLIAGCSSSGSSPVRYYLIEPVAITDLASNEGLSIEITDLDIPQYLEKFQIASRSADNQLTYSDVHQWGESLRKNLSRTMAQNLSHYLGTPDIGTPTHRSASKPDYRVQIYIDRFERDASGYVQLASRWHLASGTDRKVLHTRTSNMTSSTRTGSGDYRGTVEAMSDLVDQLSRQIADAIAEREKTSE